MGRTVCAAVAADPDLTLVAAVDRNGAGEQVRRRRGGRSSAGVRRRPCDVVVDFTVAEAARATLPWLGVHGIHAVVGTTGFTDDDLDVLRGDLRPGDDAPNCLIAPNFAISAVLMMRFAEMAAPWFDTAEVIELHHTRKIDAPSGTAVKTIERMAAAREHRLPGRSHRDRGATRASRGERARATSVPTRCGWRAWSPTRR